MKLIKRRISYMAASIMVLMMLLSAVMQVSAIPVYADAGIELAITFTTDESILSQVSGSEVAVQLYYAGTVAGAIKGELGFDNNTASFLGAIGYESGSNKGNWSVNEHDSCVRYAWVDTFGAPQNEPVMTFYFALDENASETQFALIANETEAYGTSGQGNVTVVEIPTTVSVDTLVYVKPLPAVEIVSQPTDFLGEAGERVHLSVEAIGNDLTYQWQYQKVGSTSWLNSGLANAKTSTLSFTMTQSYNGMKFRCKVRDNAGNEVISQEALITLFTGPKIIDQPVSCEQAKGKKVSFSVSATGDGLTYQWQYLRPGNTNWMNSGLAGAKSNSITFNMSAGYDGMQFHCVVTDENGQSVISNDVSCTLRTGPVIVIQPTSVEQAVGTPVTLSVTATGNELSYKWQFLRSGTTTWKGSTATGATTDSISFNMAAGHDGMKFRCLVTDADGNTTTSDNALLTVIPGPGIVTQPQSTEVPLGVSVMLKISAKGSGLSYQWQFQKPGTTTWRKSGLAGSTSTELKFKMSSGYDGMKFRCVVTDENGYSATSNEALITALEGPGVITQPSDVSASTGTTVKLTTLAVGTDVTYRWQYQRATATTWSNSGLPSASLSTLSFKMSSGYDGMKFRCKITDADGYVAYTDTAVITMVDGPAITKHPEDCTTAIGSKATFSISATGNNLSYQWQYQKVGKTTWTNSMSTGNKSNTLKVGATTGTNGMKFRCVVTDSEGNISISYYATLTAKATE